MKKFAVVLEPDDGIRFIKEHPVLKNMPESLAKKFLSFLSVKKAGTILDSASSDNLGCLIDVHALFANWGGLEERDRFKIIQCIEKALNRMEIEVLCFPWIHQYLNDHEIIYLKRKGIIVLDGFYHLLAGLLLVIDRLFNILAMELPHFEIGIWGADNDVGQVWAEAVARRVNYLCIGGRDLRELHRLADAILKTTGLSCQITDKPEVCLSKKNVTISTEPVEITFPRINPSFHFPVYVNRKCSNIKRDIDERCRQKKYIIELGWMTLPNDVRISHKLNPWEELVVLDGLFYNISHVYRSEILNNRITLENIEKIHVLYDMYPIKLQGFINQGRRVHFDRFRREYF